ncbi:hypothetical protein GQ651_11450 [Alphaproteobacteria bacterium GH1-50]|uniref:Flp pilus assembly pilin Flp n=1 Tax=Kangsaoukella pontilimi TaxID=2691042 RepID=A0A7C9J3X5_9RHOB|nr:hypothetical protein [Kangsaoukella pontilimi]MXQ08461.1 hypothetical protein [Kangsaoukella pontilimi]
MRTLLKTFLADEAGAITVDWVILCAAIVGLAIAVLTAVGDGTMTFADRLSLWMSDAPITTTY